MIHHLQAVRNHVCDGWTSVRHGIRGRSDMAVAKVKQLMVLKHNNYVIPEIAFLRGAETGIHARTQAH